METSQEYNDWLDGLGQVILDNPEPQSLKCECGSESVGGLKHSAWCPLFKEETSE